MTSYAIRIGKEELEALEQIKKGRPDLNLKGKADQIRDIYWIGVREMLKREKQAQIENTKELSTIEQIKKILKEQQEKSSYEMGLFCNYIDTHQTKLFPTY